MFKFSINKKISLKKFFGVLFIGFVFFGQINYIFANTAGQNRGQGTANRPGDVIVNTTNTSGRNTENMYNGPNKPKPTNSRVDFACSTGSISFDGIKGPDLTCMIASLSFNVVMRGSAWVMGLSGQLFDLFIKYTITDAKTNMFPQEQGQNYIEKSWEQIRNLVNIMFIFIILYIGIMTIIKGTEFGTTKMLSIVVVVAILLNFSLYFTKTFIDLGNIVALKLHSQLSETIDMSEGKGISGAIISAFGFQNIYKLSSSGSTHNSLISSIGGSIKKDDYGAQIIYFLFASAIFLITAIIIFIAGFLFLTRYIMLIFLIILSSAAIGSHILPQLKSGIWNKWLNALIGQVLFAPAFLLLFLITANIISGVKEGTNWGVIFQIGSNGTDIVDALTGTLIPFFIVMASLVATIILSKKLSDMAGSHAGTITKYMAGGALGATTWLTRKTIGAGTSAALNSAAVKNLANNPNSRLARTIGGAGLALGSKAKNATWDIRNAKGVSKLLGKTGVNFGEASKKSVESDKKAVEKKLQERAGRREYTSEQKEKISDKYNRDAKFISKNDDSDELKALTGLNNIKLDEEIKTRQDSIKTEEELIKTLEKTNKDLDNQISNIEKTKSSMSLAEQIDADRKIKNIREEQEKNKDKIKDSKNKTESIREEINTRETAKTRLKDNLNQKIDSSAIKSRYYANMAGIDSQTGKAEKGFIPRATRYNLFNLTRNSAAREAYKKTKKVESEEDKLIKALAKKMKEGEEPKEESKDKK